jgi:serine/threonine-protein kinase HipA
MQKIIINCCPGTLAEGFKTYSPLCRKLLFNGKKVSPFLSFPSPSSGQKMHVQFTENQSRISISGVQEKYAVLLDDTVLRLTIAGEQGQYILKPIPDGVKYPDQLPANEHLTMQIAKQVFKIKTAENALVFFADDKPAYLTKRFDVNDNGEKRAKEDFASLAQKTPQSHGTHYKYTGSYLDLFHLLEKYVPAYPVEAVKLYRLILFNFLFSNGDAHLKNFSILETDMGDHILSPAYDLLNTHIHIDDQFFALDEELLPGRLRNGSILQQFNTLAREAKIPEKTQENILKDMTTNSEKVEALIQRSFLSENKKRNYLQSYQTRLNRLTK